MKDVDANEARLWNNVEFYDIQETFFPGIITPDTLVDRVDRDAIESLIIKSTVSMHTNAILLDYHFAFVDANLVDHLYMTMENAGYVLATNGVPSNNSYGSSSPFVLKAFYGSDSIPYQALVENHIKCQRALKCNDLLKTTRSHMRERRVAGTAGESDVRITPRQEFGLHPTKIATHLRARFSCYIDFREDLMYNYMMLNEEVPLNGVGKKVIGIGVPSIGKGAGQNISQVSLLRSFLPFFAQSLTAEDKNNFHFNIYVGFDAADPVFDDSLLRGMVLDSANQFIQDLPATLHLVRFPYSNAWLTYIWNGLFIQAMRNGADYFFQVPGWASNFVRRLEESDGLGVVGPYDPAWKCKLLTQAMVSRKHYEIFGFLYPVQIKDWYSDFWLSRVYGLNHTLCSRDFFARNLREKGSRYTHCARPKWKDAVRAGQDLLKRTFPTIFSGITIANLTAHDNR